MEVDVDVGVVRVVVVVATGGTTGATTPSLLPSSPPVAATATIAASASAPAITPRPIPPTAPPVAPPPAAPPASVEGGVATGPLAGGVAVSVCATAIVVCAASVAATASAVKIRIVIAPSSEPADRFLLVHILAVLNCKETERQPRLAQKISNSISGRSIQPVIAITFIVTNGCTGCYDNRCCPDAFNPACAVLPPARACPDQATPAALARAHRRSRSKHCRWTRRTVRRW